MHTPTVFVAFGVTGDLMAQKILPGIFALHERNELPDNFEILGVSRRDWDDATLREHVFTALGATSTLRKFVERIRFVKGDVSDPTVFDTLAAQIGDRNAILYFSLSPALYTNAFEKLGSSALGAKAPQLRIMLEKPFGTSGPSARELHHALAVLFDETQVYRVDHYLAKEALRGLPAIEEALVEKIAVFFMEKGDIGARGESYDSAGALRDVAQNHMLEMFAAAVSPADRASALERLHPLSPSEVGTQTVRAQYEGYAQTNGVAAHTETETYFKVQTHCGDIMVTLEGGKALHQDRKELVITYKNGAEHILPIGANKERSEYERLVYDCVSGDHSLFVSMREVTALWRFIDPIIEGWAAGQVPLRAYMPGAPHGI